jgi:dihydrofolate reductase
VEKRGASRTLVHGAGTAQLALTAVVLDELEIHLIPVLLGQGQRLFDNLVSSTSSWSAPRTLEGEAGVTHLHYRIKH